MATMMSAGAGGAVGQLSFRRIIDIPFETCVAALENWQRTEQDGELRIGHSLLRGPIEHDRPSGTCRIEVRLARGPLRPLLRMRLNIDRWSWPPARTALELIPCDRVRPTAAYFRSGHLLLDSLTRSLPRHAPGQRLDHVPASRPTARQGLPGPTEQSPADLDPDHHRAPGRPGRVPGDLEQPLAEVEHQPGILRRPELAVDGQAEQVAVEAAAAVQVARAQHDPAAQNVHATIPAARCVTREG